jgi:hypothetical protein
LLIEPNLSHKFKSELSSNNRCGSLQRRNRHIAVPGIEQPADLAATGLHALGQTLA